MAVGVYVALGEPPGTTTTLLLAAVERPAMLGPFDRQALVDLMINAIPFAILAVFAGVFFVFSPWTRFDLTTAIQFGLLLHPAVGVVFVTYWGALLIARSNDEDGVRASHHG